MMTLSSMLLYYLSQINELPLLPNLLCNCELIYLMLTGATYRQCPEEDIQQEALRGVQVDLCRHRKVRAALVGRCPILLAGFVLLDTWLVVINPCGEFDIQLRL